MGKKHIQIYTDGSCYYKTKEGGWAAILLFDDKEIQIKGRQKSCTNNMMELMAAAQALLYVHENHLSSYNITLYSDSEYVVKGFNFWKDKWIEKNWKNVKNIPYWKSLIALAEGLTLKFEWVRGHSKNKYNEMVDKLASYKAKE